MDIDVEFCGFGFCFGFGVLTTTYSVLVLLVLMILFDFALCCEVILCWLSDVCLVLDTGILVPGCWVLV